MLAAVAAVPDAVAERQGLLLQSLKRLDRVGARASKGGVAAAQNRRARNDGLAGQAANYSTAPPKSQTAVSTMTDMAAPLSTEAPGLISIDIMVAAPTKARQPRQMR